MIKIIDDYLNFAKNINDNYKIKKLYTRQDGKFWAKFYLESSKIIFEFDYQSKCNWKKDYGKFVTNSFKAVNSDQIIIFYNINNTIELCIYKYLYHIVDDSKHDPNKHIRQKPKYIPNYSFNKGQDYMFSFESKNSKRILKVVEYLCKD